MDRNKPGPSRNYEVYISRKEIITIRVKARSEFEASCIVMDDLGYEKAGWDYSGVNLIKDI